MLLMNIIPSWFCSNINLFNITKIINSIADIIESSVMIVFSSIIIIITTIRICNQESIFLINELNSYFFMVSNNFSILMCNNFLNESFKSSLFFYSLLFKFIHIIEVNSNSYFIIRICCFIFFINELNWVQISLIRNPITISKVRINSLS